MRPQIRVSTMPLAPAINSTQLKRHRRSSLASRPSRHLPTTAAANGPLLRLPSRRPSARRASDAAANDNPALPAAAAPQND